MKYIFTVRLPVEVEIDDLKYHIKNLKTFKGRGFDVALEYHEELLRLLEPLLEPLEEVENETQPESI